MKAPLDLVQQTTAELRALVEEMDEKLKASHIPCTAHQLLTLVSAPGWSRFRADCFNRLLRGIKSAQSNKHREADFDYETSSTLSLTVSSRTWARRFPPLPPRDSPDKKLAYILRAKKPIKGPFGAIGQIDDFSASAFVHAANWRITRSARDALPETVDHDMSLQFDPKLSRAHLVIPMTLEREGGPTSGCRLCAIDPGVRRFAMVYDNRGSTYAFGVNDTATFERISKRIGALQSEIQCAENAQLAARSGSARLQSSPLHPSPPAHFDLTRLKPSTQEFIESRRIKFNDDNWLPRWLLPPPKTLSRGQIKGKRKEIARLYKRLRDLTADAHRAVALELVRHWDVILLPSFNVSEMVKKKNEETGKKRVIGKLTTRGMLTWRHAGFRKVLRDLAAKHGKLVVEVSEAYTSKTCGGCGEIHQNLGGRRVFKCDRCDFHVDRDMNGARNIMLRFLTDAASFGFLSAGTLSDELQRQHESLVPRELVDDVRAWTAQFFEQSASAAAAAHETAASPASKSSKRKAESVVDPASLESLPPAKKQRTEVIINNAAAEMQRSSREEHATFSSD